MNKLLRPIRSIYDYIVYFEFGLSERPRLYFMLWVAGFALSFGVGQLGPADWGKWAGLALPAYGLAWFIKVALGPISPWRAATYRWRKDAGLAARIEQSQPCAADADRGWRAVPPGVLVAGGVHVNRDFNVHCMANPDWDLAFDETGTKTHYAGVLKQIRQLRRPLRPHAFRVFLGKIFDGMALINEPKIAIASDFYPGMPPRLDVYKSSYLATWCSADLAHSSILEDGPSRSDAVWPAMDRVPFVQDQGVLRLDPLSVSARKRSTQIGINLLGISRDRILLIATQGSKTMVGQDQRVPLATGSMDWADRLAATTFKDLGRLAALREIREEWGNNAALSRTRALDFTAFLPLGVFRVPGRSGKPEFAAIATLNWDEADLEADQNEVHAYADQTEAGVASHRYPVPDFPTFKAAVHDLLHNQGQVMDTAPLFGVLICLQDLIDTDPDRVRATLGF